MIPSSLRTAFRQFHRNPGFSAVAVATLALGIGANTAFFSVLNGTLFRPLPYPHQERLVFFTETSATTQDMSVSYPDFRDWLAQQDAFSHLALYKVTDADLKASAQTYRVSMALVTSQFFDVLGVSPAQGRAPAASDDTPAAPPVAWLTHSAWRRYLDGAPDIVGKAIIVDGLDVTVAGVLPASFRFTHDVDVYMMLAPQAGRQFMTARENHNDAYGLGLLKPGLSLASARIQMDSIATRLQHEYPKADADIGIRIERLRDRLAGSSRMELLLLCGAVGAVLLIACVNIANMLLARSFSRAREMALRSALGATRRQLVGQLLAESLSIAFVGGVLGLLLGSWGYTLVDSLLPSQLRDFVGSSPTLDVRVLLFTLAITVATGVGFGLAPAWQTSAVAPSDALKNTPRIIHTRFGRWHLRDLLVGVQIALALVLLVGASLMIRSLHRLLAVPPGIQPNRVLTLQISPVNARIYAEDPMAVPRFYERVTSTVKALPDVADAAIATGIPFSHTYSYSAFYLDGKPLPQPGHYPSASNQMVSADFFHVLGVPLLKGRLFDGREREPVVPPGLKVSESSVAEIYRNFDLSVIVNRKMAETYWPGQDPIGRRFRLGFPDMKLPWCRVIGVVGNIVQHGLDQGAEAEFYYSPRQFPNPTTPYLIVRTRLSPAAAAAEITKVLRSTFPDNPVFDVKPMTERMDDFVAGRRYNMQLFVFFAGTALLLALIGLYGVLSFVIGQRSREIGIRIALGATRAQVLGDVMRHGLALVVPGLLLGVASGWAVVRLLQSQLFEVAPNDLLSYAIAVVLLLVVGAIASYLPALRAVRINPVDAIRTE
ncbi:macrolide export ATP-binding/permease protein MacB [mine drainage metagenome]|uniref:Macrolide export ATP-binding/permease protein MacB n=1 Tax=mine drainage metagenome TaxID=410659 RepID=A0A1J5SUM7_9ZZZZ